MLAVLVLLWDLGTTSLSALELKFLICSVRKLGQILSSLKFIFFLNLSILHFSHSVCNKSGDRPVFIKWISQASSVSHRRNLPVLLSCSVC